VNHERTKSSGVADGVSSVVPPADRWSPGKIGEVVASSRRARKLKVSELARMVGVTPSLISQIEHGNSRPSVATLFALADALDVSVDLFAGRSAPLTTGAGAEAPVLQAPAPGNLQRYVVRRDERRSIAIEGGVQWEMLTPDPVQELGFLERVYTPHPESNTLAYPPPGAEMVLGLEGRFEIHVGFELYELSQGDSIHFPSSIPHRYVNPTDEVARAVTVILRDPGVGQGPPNV
jgi:transcriptional regulator with XRE-family HTH domain